MRDDKHKTLNRSLLAFLDSSPTPFHATENMAAELAAGGFERLNESSAWALKPGGRYFVIRNDSSLIAWQQGVDPLEEQGVRLLGAHTDSPNLRVRPNAVKKNRGVTQFAVDVYGGVLLNPWFDRDLSLAGRVHYERRMLNQEVDISSTLIDLKCPIGILPSLAIHLDREANSKRNVNAQLHTPVYVAASGMLNHQDSDADEFRQLVLQQVQLQDADAIKVLDYEVAFYDVQKASIVGLQGDLIASARLDNLLSCFIDLRAFMDSETESWKMLVCSDHEEVGSQSNAGAAGPFLKQTLQRIAGSAESLARAMHHSVLISTDNAHALHANYVEKMEPAHSPALNAGPVIKVNANQRYASNSETQALFRSLCARHEIPVQSFVTRGDMGCGSTIGPITSAEIGVKTLDLGVPTLAMHSIRETAGYDDSWYLYLALKHFLQRD